MSDRVFEKIGFLLKSCVGVYFLDISFLVILYIDLVLGGKKGFSMKRCSGIDFVDLSS